MELSRRNLEKIPRREGLMVPGENVFSLPEKVIQFGTGVLLRGLPDFFIDKANRKGIFNGRVVVVKSTSSGGADAFSRQNGLYTLCIKGYEQGETIEERVINSSISRVLQAKEQWEEILQCAKDPSIQIVISNTTEVGITFVEEKIEANPPESFPAKLLAYLYARYKAFNGSPESGMIIIPTELIPDNASQLRSIILRLCEVNRLPKEFTDWLISSNDFCDSLVDRIVPGRLPDTERVKEEAILGYTDDLMIMAESFCLWAIQSSSERVRKILGFAASDEGVVIADSIEKFRELKLRLLNGTHSFSCALAILAGYSTVRDAMGETVFNSYVRNLMMQEIVPAVSNGVISVKEAESFSEKVIDRFCNPHLNHKWTGIAVQYASKMKMRNVPVLLEFYRKAREVPAGMALGFAAFLRYMKCMTVDGQFMGNVNGVSYAVVDDHAGYFAAKWSDNDPERLVDAVIADAGFWGADLSAITGFAGQLKFYLREIEHRGSSQVMKAMMANKLSN